MISGRLRAAAASGHVGAGSIFICDLVARAYQEALERHARGAMVDLGCGEVPLYECYSRHVTNTVCVDWPQSLHEANHVDVFADLTQPLPIADGSADTIILTDVLEHIPTPQRLLDEIARVLRPGGKCVLGIPFMYWLHEEPHDYFRYTEHALRRLLETAGLRVVELEPYGGAREVLLDLVAKNVVARSAVLTRAFTFLSRRLHPGLRDRTWRAGPTAFPLGYVGVALRPSEPPEAGRHESEVAGP